MIMKRVLLIVSALAFAAGCSSMNVNYDYDRQADFSSYKTYSWHESQTSLREESPLAHERIIQAVDAQLQSHGFQRVAQNPDVVVTYHSQRDQEMTLNTDYMGTGWGYGSGWYWGGGYGMGMTSSTTTVRTYDIGTIVLDMWDSDQKRLVWRGTVSDTISDNPENNAQKITAGAQKLFERYPPVGM
jgi:hypothetical protein